MRLAKRIIEDINSYESLMATLRKDCSKFIEEMHGARRFFWRGTTADGNELVVTRKPRLEDRRPLNTAPEIHDMMNKAFQEKYGWKVRNGIFVTNLAIDAKSYGTPRIFFPKGDYTYLWSPDVSDLYVQMSKYDSLFDEDDRKQNWRTFQRSQINAKEGVWSATYNSKKFEGPRIDDILDDFEKKNPELTTRQDHQYDWKEEVWYCRIVNDVGQQVAAVKFTPKVSKARWMKDMKAKFDVKFKEWIDSYRDYDLRLALNIGHEVTFKCDEFYLVHQRAKEAIEDLFDAT
jgi:hypothetical protein